MTVAYIGDVVVDRDYVGQGLGSQMLKRLQVELVARRIEQIFVDCHEENLASRGMIEKSGFVEVEVFSDPERRFVGSRRTCVSVWNKEMD